jgi:hypothetical protein
MEKKQKNKRDEVIRLLSMQDLRDILYRMTGKEREKKPEITRIRDLLVCFKKRNISRVNLE